jgi:hypothetical protein
MKKKSVFSFIAVMAMLVVILCGCKREKEQFLAEVTTEPLIIEVLNGELVIDSCEYFWRKYPAYDLKDCDLRNTSNITKEVIVKKYELAQDATILQAANSLSDNWDELCLTKYQIMRFCEKYPEHIRWHRTHFLSKKDDKYFVFSAILNFDDLYVISLPGDHNVVFHLNIFPPTLSGRSHSFIFPQ